jgi:tetratricopeptide (TPR) repeat protein/DNA-binding CsgD family transcriptional regulator
LPRINLLFDMNHRKDSPAIYGVALLLSICLTLNGCKKESSEPLPDAYKQSGAFIKVLPYYNPDSCVMLIRRDVPPRWQGAAYENLFLDGPEDSPLELGFKHLDAYEKNFPADTAWEFAQLWRGRLYVHLGKLDSAQACLQASYEGSIRHGRYIRAGDAQNGLAIIYYKKGNTAQAIRSYLAVYEAVKNLDTAQTNRKIVAIANIAAAYSKADDQREALAWVQRNLTLVSDERIPSLRADKVNTFKQLAVIYDRLSLPDSAILLASAALELQEKYQTINDRSSLLLILGKAYLSKGACPTALQYVLQGLHSRRAERPAYRFQEEGSLADAYLCLGRLDSAEILYKRLLQSSDPNTLSHAYTNLADIYARQSQYKAAYDALQNSLKIRQEIFNDKKIQEMAVAKSELQLERTQHKLIESKQQHARERLQKLVTALTLLLALSIVLALFFRQRNRRRLLEQHNQLLAQEKELAEAREILKNQELEHTHHILKDTQEQLNTSNSLLALKDSLIEELELRFHQEHLAPGEVSPPDSAEGPKHLRMKILTEEDWMLFRERFEQQVPGFLQHLKTSHPSLTAAEVRLFLLMKLNFDTLEISEALGISKPSVWRSRHRLAQKLNLKETGDLDGFVQLFG